jgi:hypothetical protein
MHHAFMHLHLACACAGRTADRINNDDTIEDPQRQIMHEVYNSIQSYNVPIGAADYLYDK